MLAVPYQKPFVVDDKKVEEFKNSKPNLEIRNRNNEFLKRCTNIKFEESMTKKLILKKTKPLK